MDCSLSTKGLQGTSSGLKQQVDGGSCVASALMPAWAICESQKARLAEAAHMGMGAESPPRARAAVVPAPLYKLFLSPSSTSDRTVSPHSPVPTPTHQLQLPPLPALRVHQSIVPILLTHLWSSLHYYTQGFLLCVYRYIHSKYNTQNNYFVTKMHSNGHM